MGIKKLKEFILAHKHQLCSTSPVRGKVIVDGWSILHELYCQYKVEWNFGGCYIEQLKATTHFYNTLVRVGIEPIVIVKGGGSESLIEHSICRRSAIIGSILGDLRKQHENYDTKEYASHRLPILSWHVYVSSLKQLKGVQVYVADGKAHNIVVQLANTYGCPVLTNSTIYCVSGIAGGVIFIDDLEFGPDNLTFGSLKLTTDDLQLETCSAPIFKQSELVTLLYLQNPDLIYVFVAIMGDGDDLPYQYHGRVRAVIEYMCTYMGTQPDSTSIYFNISVFLRGYQYQSFKDFTDRVDSFTFGKQHHSLLENCHTAFEMCNIQVEQLNVASLHSTSTLPCLTSSKSFSKHVLGRYRVGSFPDAVIDAVSVGKCTLNPDLGDPNQPPVQQIGRHIRTMMYGMAMPLSPRRRRIVEEYYRSDKQINGKWDYVPFKVEPVLKYEHLSVEHIFDFDANDSESREKAAKTAMCDMLEMPKDALMVFSGPLDKDYLLGILVTNYWAQYLFQKSQLDESKEIIKALVVNFFYSPEQKGAHQNHQYQHPKWIEVYHALLEWQSLYLDVCSLNAMLLSPFLELSLSNIFHGSFVMELALGADPEGIAKYRSMLAPLKQSLYDRIIELVIK